MLLTLFVLNVNNFLNLSCRCHAERSEVSDEERYEIGFQSTS